MVIFKYLKENSQSSLIIAENAKALANNAKQTFAVYPSMLRPSVFSNLDTMRGMFPTELTSQFNIGKGGPAYLLKSVLKEKKSGDTRLPMLGRRISKGIVRWGSSNLKIGGDFTHIPLYWEWTEDVLSRYAGRLKNANIYNVVYASLYQYDREPRIVRAFCESWCPSTNTLHTTAGEWSLSLWDLHEIGGLPIAGRRYDEAIPSFKNMKENNDEAKSIPSACEYLFRAHCLLASHPESKNVVHITQWIQFWCKCKSLYDKPIREANRRQDTRPKSSHIPKAEIFDKPLEWTSEEDAIFKELGVLDDSVKRTVYLAAFLVCWLCVFVLPEAEDSLIRAETFEVAAHMAEGTTYSLAIPLLASIYHGLNKMVNADRPSSSGSVFPSHYLYGWLAHYFDTHHVTEDVPPNPLMIRYSGSRSAKRFTDVEARNLIHDGSSFKASSLVLRESRCLSICDDKLDARKLGYIISLRTAYLPLRSKSSFFLEPYHPTRFCRQFGFYQDVPGILPRDADDGYVSYEVALKHLRLLILKNSQTTLILLGRFLNWRDLTTTNFRQWWAKVNVSDLREDINLLLSSVGYRTKNNATDVDTTSKKVFRKRRGGDIEALRAQEHLLLFGHDSDGEEVPNALCESMVVIGEDRYVQKTCMPLMQENRHVIGLPSSPAQLKSVKTLNAGATPTGSPSTHTAKMNDQLIGVLLNNLINAPLKDVKDVAAHVVIFLGTIRDSGGDISILQAAVKAYVESVIKLLAIKEDVANSSEQYTHDFSDVDGLLRSAQVTYKCAIQTNKSLEKQGEITAKVIEHATTKLQALHDEAKSIKDQRGQQVKIISAAKLDVDGLQQKLDELKTSQVSSSDLMTHAEQELGQCKRAIKAIIH